MGLCAQELKKLMNKALHQIRRFSHQSTLMRKPYYFMLNTLEPCCAYNLNLKLRSPYSKLEIKEDIIFVHIPKAAGNTIIHSLYNENASTGHDTLSRYLKYNKKRYNSSYRFSVVRNPLDRFVSSFHYLKQGGLGYFDKKFRNIYLSNVNSFNDFVEKMRHNKSYKDKIMQWIHFMPQFHFISHDGKTIDLHQYLRIEQLDHDFPKLADKLGRKNTKLITVNSSNHGLYRNYYSDKNKEFIADLYALDFSLLGYGYED